MSDLEPLSSSSIGELHAALHERLEEREWGWRRCQLLARLTVTIAIGFKLAGLNPGSTFGMVLGWVLRFSFGGAFALGARRLALNLKVATLEGRISEADVERQLTN